MLAKLMPNLFRPAYWRHIGQDVVLVWHLTRDPRVPLYIKIVPILAVVYLIVPVDLIPGFLPIIGQLDDLAILTLAIQMCVRLAPQSVVEEYRQTVRGDRQLQTG